MRTFAQLTAKEKLGRIEAAYRVLFGDTQETTGNEEFLVSEALSIICGSKTKIELASLTMLGIKTYEQDKQDKRTGK